MVRIILRSLLGSLCSLFCRFLSECTDRILIQHLQPSLSIHDSHAVHITHPDSIIHQPVSTKIYRILDSLLILSLGNDSRVACKSNLRQSVKIFNTSCQSKHVTGSVRNLRIA